MSRLCVVVLVTVLLAVPAAGFAQSLDNPGFETGDFPLWVVTDSAPQPSNVFPVVFDNTGIIDTYESEFGPGYWDPAVSYSLLPYDGAYSCGWARQGAPPPGFPGPGRMSYIDQTLSVTPGLEYPIFIDCAAFVHHDRLPQEPDPWGSGILFQVFKDAEEEPTYQFALWRDQVLEYEPGRLTVPDGVWQEISLTENDLSEDPLTRILTTTGELTFTVRFVSKHSVNLDACAVDNLSLAFDKPGLGDIHGTVTEPSGGPAVEGALVVATPEGSEPYGGTCYTNASGGYQINALEPGTYTITCTKDHYITFEQTGVVVQADTVTTLNIEFAPIPLGTISGYITDELNDPLEGAEVNASCATYTAPTTYTNELGYYEMPGVDVGTYTVVADYPGYLPGEATGIVVTEGGNTPANIQLQVRPFTGVANGGFELPVTDPLNDPIPQWQVWNAGWDGMTGFFPEVTADQSSEGSQSMINYFGAYYAEGVTEPDGSFVLENVRTTARPGQETSFDVTVTKDGYLSSTKRDIKVYPDANTDAGTFVLSPPGLSGLVLDFVSEDPIVGATVTAVEDGGGTPVVATTNDDGVYRMNYLAPGTYTVTAESAGYITQIEVAVEVTDDTNTQVDFLLHTPGISGTITKLGDGGPVGSVTVTATSTTQGPYSTVTNSLGKYHLDAAPETYTVTGTRFGYKTVTAENVVVVAGEVTIQDFEMEIGFGAPLASAESDPPNDGYGSISGNVEDWDGNPLAGAEVSATGPDSWGAYFGAYQQVYVQPGKTYELSGYWKSEVDIPGANNWATVGVVDGVYEFDDEDDAPIGVQWIAKHDTNGVPNAQPPQPPLGPTPFAWEWESFDDAPYPQTAWFQGRVTATGEILTIVLGSGHPLELPLNPSPEAMASVYFDDISLVEVEGGAARNIAEAAQCWEGSPVDLSRPEDAKVVTGVFDYTGFGFLLRTFYIEDEDRTAGIQVEADIGDPLPAIGDKVSLTGTIGVRRVDPLDYYEPGERVLVADAGSIVVRSSGNDLPDPVGVTNEAMTGAFDYLTPMPEVFGAPNQGLLVTVWGKVVGEPFYGPYGALDYQIDDGSGVGVLVNTNQWFQDPSIIPAAGTYVAVTGCSGIENYNYTPMKTIRPRPDMIYSDIYIVPTGP